MSVFRKGVEDRLEQLRLRPADLARLLQFHPATISRWLSGDREPHISIQKLVWSKLGIEGALPDQTAKVLEMGGVDFREMFAFQALRARYRLNEHGRQKIEVFLEELFHQDAKAMIDWLKENVLERTNAE
jgi:hypothetical protein